MSATMPKSKLLRARDMLQVSDWGLYIKPGQFKWRRVAGYATHCYGVMASFDHVLGPDYYMSFMIRYRDSSWNDPSHRIFYRRAGWRIDGGIGDKRVFASVYEAIAYVEPRIVAKLGAKLAMMREIATRPWREIPFHSRRT
jgi:hypothetical protein